MNLDIHGHDPGQVLKPIPFTVMTATQSSTSHGGNAGKPLVPTPQAGWPGTCTHTHKDTNAWWKVSLGSWYEVSSIKLTSRARCCPERLQGVDIFVGTTKCTSKVHIDAGATETIECVGTGSEIKIQAPDRRHLTLCGSAAYGVKAGAAARSAFSQCKCLLKWLKVAFPYSN